MPTPLSCQFVRRRQGEVEGGAKPPEFAASPPHSDAFGRRRIKFHSPDCRGKGGTKSGRYLRLWAILRQFFDIGLRPEAAALVKDGSRVLARVALPRELWRHNPCATTHPRERRGQAGTVDLRRLLYQVNHERRSSRMPIALLVPRHRGEPPFH